MKGICLGVMCAVILGMATGCSSSRAEPTVDDTANQVELDASDNGGRVELKVGQVLAITLETNPTTGYGWSVTELDDAILQQKGSPLYQPLGSEEDDGVGGLGTFRFEAVGVGQTALELAYRSSPDEEPATIFFVQVVVR